MKTNSDDKMSAIKTAGGAYLTVHECEQRTAIRESDADIGSRHRPAVQMPHARRLIVYDGAVRN
jgi:hypothetical protein